LLNHQLKLEEQQRRESVLFRAKPATVLFKPPFEPKAISGSGMRGPIHQNHFPLATAIRAIERRKFDQEVKLKTQANELRKKQVSHVTLINSRSITHNAKWIQCRALNGFVLLTFYQTGS